MYKIILCTENAFHILFLSELKSNFFFYPLLLSSQFSRTATTMYIVFTVLLRALDYSGKRSPTYAYFHSFYFYWQRTACIKVENITCFSLKHIYTTYFKAWERKYYIFIDYKNRWMRNSFFFFGCRNCICFMFTLCKSSHLEFIYFSKNITQRRGHYRNELWVSNEKSMYRGISYDLTVHFINHSNNDCGANLKDIDITLKVFDSLWKWAVFPWLGGKSLVTD